MISAKNAIIHDLQTMKHQCGRSRRMQVWVWRFGKIRHDFSYPVVCCGCERRFEESMLRSLQILDNFKFFGMQHWMKNQVRICAYTNTSGICTLHAMCAFTFLNYGPACIHIYHFIIGADIDLPTLLPSWDGYKKLYVKVFCSFKLYLWGHVGQFSILVSTQCKYLRNSCWRALP